MKALVTKKIGNRQSADGQSERGAFPLIANPKI
jgi:hypothetical protein